MCIPLRLKDGAEVSAKINLRLLNPLLLKLCDILYFFLENI